MRDKVALITAGSAGLGKATAHALASMQMRVVINYSENSERAEQCIRELYKIYESDDTGAATKTRFLAIKADVSKRSAVEQLVHDTVAEMGQLDVVFSNHGWTKPTHFTSLDENVNEEDWDRAFNMNVKSHLFLMHAAKEHLQATKGTFITTASVAGVVVGGSSVASYLLSDTVYGYTYWRTGIRCHQVRSDPPCQVSCCDSKSKHTS
jgi:NAD(P)-dependent dehydrogenase (short-subunit alcohol dehydrogenase family)